jgi:two-component system, NarL family, nitrate/nitrite response regulator NarL
MADAIRLLIVAETRLYREGLVRMLGSTRRLRVAGSVGSLEEALGSVAAATPIDVALVDMGIFGAREAIQELLRLSPETRVVVMAIHDLQAEVVAAAVAGATGYLTRDASRDELVETLYRAARGEVTCSAPVAAALVRIVAEQATVRSSFDLPDLTSRERQIVGLISQGLSNKEIARRLYIALPTVKNHVHNILEKLQVTRRLDVAERVGWGSRPTWVPERLRA